MFLFYVTTNLSSTFSSFQLFILLIAGLTTVNVATELGIAVDISTTMSQDLGYVRAGLANIFNITPPPFSGYEVHAFGAGSMKRLKESGTLLLEALKNLRMDTNCM